MTNGTVGQHEVRNRVRFLFWSRRVEVRRAMESERLGSDEHFARYRNRDQRGVPKPTPLRIPYLEHPSTHNCGREGQTKKGARHYSSSDLAENLPASRASSSHRPVTLEAKTSSCSPRISRNPAFWRYLAKKTSGKPRALLQEKMLASADSVPYIKVTSQPGHQAKVSRTHDNQNAIPKPSKIEILNER